jgi:hypothetical protein
VDDQSRKVRALFLVGEQAAVLRGNKAVGVCTRHQALRPVFESEQHVVRHLLDAPEPGVVDPLAEPGLQHIPQNGFERMFERVRG